MTTRPPLPEPLAGALCVPAHLAFTADQINAYADTVLAAARDCRTCKNLAHRHFRAACMAESCTNADHYEPLPPVRLWKEST